MREKTRQVIPVGVAIYRRDQWSRWLAAAVDRDQLEATWEEWHAVLQASKPKMRAAGMEPVEVLVDLDEFERYCREKHRSNQASTRAQYVAELFSKR